jgi:hypothetical protein
MGVRAHRPCLHRTRWKKALTYYEWKVVLVVTDNVAWKHGSGIMLHLHGLWCWCFEHEMNDEVSVALSRYLLGKAVYPPLLFFFFFGPPSFFFVYPRSCALSDKLEYPLPRKYIKTLKPMVQ